MTLAPAFPRRTTPAANNPRGEQQCSGLIRHCRRWYSPSDCCILSGELITKKLLRDWVGMKCNDLDASEATVFVVDDDPAVRSALGMLLRSMKLRVELFPCAKDFLEAGDALRPGCVLADVRMPGMSGLEMQQHMRRQGDHRPVIVISGHGDVPMVVEAMKFGAVDFLEKPFRDRQLWDSVQQALLLDQRNRRARATQDIVAARIARLKPGEKDVLRCLLAGKSHRDIASELGLSVRTIEVRRAKMMQKMEAKTLADLIRLSIQSDLSSGDEEPQPGLGIPGPDQPAGS